MSKPAGKTEVATSMEEVERYNPALHSWDDLTQGADSVLGADLVSSQDELFDSLVGVPFVITRVIYRPSDYGTADEANYVTAELVLAPENTMRKRRVDVDSLPFFPGDSLVFNDGGTGISRQITEYLHVTGRIVLPEPVHPSGKRGESSYDLPVSKWTDIRAGEIRFDSTGRSIYTCDIRLLCPRGIRISEGYDFEGGKDGKTRYLG